MLKDFLAGSNYFFRGCKTAMRPELRRFVTMPLIVNILVFTAAIIFGIHQYDSLMKWLLPQETAWWADIIMTVMWLLFSLIVLILLFFTFNLLANFIAAPFNGLLAEKVEKHLSGTANEDAGGLRAFITSIPLSIFSEVKKLFYFILTGTIVFLLLMIPGFQIISPVIWAIFSSWMLALEYTSYSMENHGIFFSDARRKLKKKKVLALGFGIAVMLAGLIPVINFLVMPSAVTGATMLWLDQLRD